MVKFLTMRRHAIRELFNHPPGAEKIGWVNYQNILTSVLLVAILLPIGIVIVGDYGPSWDELSVQWYTQQSLAAYSSFLRNGKVLVFEDNILNNYGPAYMIVSEFIVRVLNSVGLGWQVSQWHIAIFLSFVLSVISMFFLARRWLRWWSALGTTLLFATQPLLWGHAFINPKDIPFMAFFLTTVTLGITMVEKTSQRNFLSINVLKPFFFLPVILAGSLLGFTTSIRVFGLYAGSIVILFGLIRSWRSLLKTLPAYFTIALIVCILTWPHLWENPFLNFIKSLRIMADFPWNGIVLFRGAIFHPADLPRYYYPFLISLQLTEPAVILFVIGFFISVYKMAYEKIWETFLLIVVWFIIPLLAVVYLSHTWYNNFRQLLFIVPPIFLSTGLVLDKVFDHIRSALIRIAILAVLIVPGIYSLAKLHPYEYVYFNNFIGGVSGASRNYELDYWAISYRDAALYINQIAPEEAKVIVFGPEQIFGGFARPDLKVIPDVEIDQYQTFDYAVISTSNNDDMVLCATGEVIYTIEIDTVPLTVIKKLDHAGQCP